MEKHEYLDKKMMGPDPHARPLPQLLRAYAFGAASVAPQTLLNPWLPRAAIRALALRRFRSMVSHAMTHVPYYRDRFQAAGVRPETLRTPADLSRIPVLTKPLLRDGADRMRADNAGPQEWLLERSSSGSSGSPVKLFFDPIRELPRRVQELRLLTAHGFKPWDVQLVFDHPGHLAPTRFAPQKLGLWRREMFPSWLGVEEALRIIEDSKPDILHGVLSSLRMISMAIKSKGGLSYRPKLAVSKGELLDNATRALIESALGAPLADYYATEETGIIAWQCPSGSGYHIDEDFVYVETLDEEGNPTAPGELGEITLTNLYMRAMPFIRYRVGDLGVLSTEPCPCGRGLPLLKNLSGRKVDLIINPDKEIHHPFALMVILEDVTSVARYRLIQNAENEIRIEVNWDVKADAAERERTTLQVVHAFQERMGSRVKVELEQVPDFQHGMGVKFPLVKGLGRSYADLIASGFKVKF